MSKVNPVRPKIKALLSVTCSLIILVVGIYMVISRNDYQDNFLPEYTDGASHIITSQSYPAEPDDYSHEAKRSDLVVQGVIEELLPAKWTTPNGQRPADTPEKDWQIYKENPMIHIRTPIRLKVERVFKGENAEKELIFSVAGGRVNEMAMVEEAQEGLFKLGTRVIVFLHKGEANSPASYAHPAALWPSRYLVVEDGVAHGEIKEIRLEELEKQVEQK